MARPNGQQAVLNTGHALAGRLIHGYVFSNGSGTVANIANPSITASLAGTATWTTNTNGPCIDTGGGYIDAGTSIAIPQAPFHIVVGISNPAVATAGLQALVASVRDDGAYNPGDWGLTFGWHTGDVAWVVDGNANWNGGNPASYNWYWETQAAAYAAGSHHIHLACETTGSTMYRNGATIGTSGVILPGTTAQPLTFGGIKTLQYNTDAQFEYVYIFSGSMTTEEINDLRVDPYALVSTPPTRFYLPSTGTAAINPTFDATWDDTSAVTRRPANATKGTSAFVDIRDTESSALNTWDVALGQFISAPIAAQTISGTVKGYIRAREEATGVNARSQMVIRVVSNDGATVRGTLLPQNNTTTNVSEWVVATTANSAAQSRNARFPTPTAPSTLTSVTAQDGDRIVIEVGARCVNTATTATFAVAMRFGENASDLAENETGVTEGAPWVEFSNAIQFSTGATPHSASGGMVSAKPLVSGNLTQTFPARSFSGGMISKKPIVVGTLTQSAISPHSVSGVVVSPKPRISGTLTQTFPARSISGALVTPKPLALGILTQSFPARSVFGGLVSPKPSASGNLTQTFPARSFSGGAVSTKPTISGTLTQTFPARSISGGLLSKKPISSGTLSQSSIAPHSVFGGGISNKPIVSGFLTQSNIAPHSASGGMVSAKPLVSGTISQGIISSHALLGGLVSPKPIVSGTLEQTLGEFTYEFTYEFDKTPILPSQSFSGALTSPKPQIFGSISQGVISSHALLGGLVSPKPIVSGIITETLGKFSDEFSDEFDQTIPSRSFLGSLTSPKPQISGSVSQGVISPHALLGGLMSPKPVAIGTLTQTFPARSFSGALISTKPRISGIMTQTFPARSITGGGVSPKPMISGSLTQTFPARSVSGALVSPKPKIVGSVAQGEIGASSFSALLVSPKPRVAGVLTQSAIAAQTFSGTLLSPKPITSGVLFQGALFGYEFFGGVISPKPLIRGDLTQTLLPSNLVGSLISVKPRITGTLTQTPLPNFLTGALVSPKPKVVGSVAQGQIGASSFSAILVSKKPRVAGTLTQSAIAARTFSGGLISPKPKLSGSLIQQALGGFEFSGGVVSQRPRILGTLTQTFPARFVSGWIVSKKPAITASLTQTLLPYAIGGRLISPRPRLSGSFVQNLLSPHAISGGMISPKPKMKAVPMAEPYAIQAGIEYATKGQLSLANGYLLLLVTDPEGEVPMAHPIAIAQRTVEAGYGASPLVFEGPLDPAELKYFTVTWDTELQAASDSIVPDNGTVEGQSVFLTLSGAAVAAGIQVHAFSQDERSVTFWLKVEASQQSRTQWSGVGELHVITIRIITTRGQVFERDISFRVKQL